MFAENQYGTMRDCHTFEAFPSMNLCHELIQSKCVPQSIRPIEIFKDLTLGGDFEKRIFQQVHNRVYVLRESLLEFD